MSSPIHTKHEGVACPRCQQVFTCNPSNISNCDCQKVSLTKEETVFIAEQFLDCVCPSCLLKLKYDYYLKFHHNKV